MIFTSHLGSILRSFLMTLNGLNSPAMPVIQCYLEGWGGGGGGGGGESWHAVSTGCKVATRAKGANMHRKVQTCIERCKHASFKLHGGTALVQTQTQMERRTHGKKTVWENKISIVHPISFNYLNQSPARHEQSSISRPKHSAARNLRSASRGPPEFCCEGARKTGAHPLSLSLSPSSAHRRRIRLIEQNQHASGLRPFVFPQRALVCHHPKPPADLAHIAQEPVSPALPSHCILRGSPCNVGSQHEWSSGLGSVSSEQMERSL